jgi:hypothetical protein
MQIERHAELRVLLASALVLSCTGPAALAFKGQEHSDLSMAGLAIARDCMDDVGCRALVSGEDCGPLRLDEVESAALEMLAGVWTDPGELDFTYGEFVRVVDYVLDPVALLSPNGSVTEPPRSPANLNRETIARLGSARLAQASAASVNDTHFQEKMMASWWHWHRDATATAAGDGADASGRGRTSRALFAALLMNAISNHFLEDSFAPGHVTTPRTGLHDFSALAMHDYYNRSGADFAITEGPALAALLDPERDSERLGIPVARLREIRALIAANGTVRLRGDGYLAPVFSGKLQGNTEVGGHAQVQVALVSLVVARSLVDVFQSFACERAVNSLAGYRWSPLHSLKDEPDRVGPSGRRDRLRLASAGFPFGSYTDRYEPRLEYGLMMPLEFSVQTAPLADREAARGIASIFVLPTFVCDRCSPIPGRFIEGDYQPRSWSLTFGVGAHYRFDEDLDGIGVFARGGILFQRLDLHLALGLGLERYQWDADETWRLHPELRAGLGKSFVNYVLAVGYDHDLDSKRALDGALVFRAGVTLGIPWGKVADWAARR